MFSVARSRRAKKQTGHPVPFGIPFRGINARDPMVSMPPGYAFNLINAVPEQYGIRTRKGYSEWMSAVGSEVGPVHTIMVYYPATATPAAAMAGLLNVLPMSKMFMSSVVTPLTTFGGKIFAARGADVYDVTLGGDGSLVSPETGISGATAFWSWLNFQNSAGAFLVAVNDGGGYAYYNGTAWATPTAGAGPGQIDGVDPADFVHVTEFKKRLWFVEKDSTKAWYLDVGAITGTATPFDFGEQFTKGGHLVALSNFTVDAGIGIDDYLVAVGSEGDVVIYKGIDPDTAATFNLHGVWQVGPLPRGRRSVSQRHGNVHILSQLGLIPVSKLLAMTDQVELTKISASHYIDPLIARLMQDYSGQVGWQIVDVPKEEMLLIGIPYAAASLGGDYFAMKVTPNNNAWTILRDTTYTALANVDAFCFAGTSDGRVVLAFNGALDNAISGSSLGEPIICECTPSYQPLGDPVNSKRILLMRPTLLASRNPIIRFTILTDYEPPAPLLVPTLPSVIYDLWDEGIWDLALWGGIQSPIKKWLGARGEGTAATPQIMYAAGGDTMLTSIDLWVEQGGVL